MPAECPSIEILAAYLDHGLTPEEQEVVEAHLVTCGRCREVIKAALPPDPQSAKA